MRFIMRRVELQLNCQDLPVGKQPSTPWSDALAQFAKGRSNLFFVTFGRGWVEQRPVAAGEFVAQCVPAWGGCNCAIGKRTLTVVPLLISLAICNSPPWA